MTRLKAFPLMHELHTRSYRIWTRAVLSESELRIRFKLEAAHPREFTKVNLPELHAQPERRSGLWNETCFECFIPSAHSGAYLEFNGSPSGDWDWFSFRGYREGMAEFQLPTEAQPRQTVLTRSDQQIESEWTLPMVGIRFGLLSAGDSQFDFDRIGLTAVLNTSIATTYWALAHEGVKPDFHHPSGFIYDPIRN